MAEIQQTTQNPLFGRKEVIIEVNKDEYEPTYKNAINIIAEKFSISKESFKINKIDVEFGSKTFKIHANVYSSPEEKSRLEKDSKKEQEAVQKMEEEKKQAEQAQESVSEEVSESGSSEEPNN